MLFTVYIYIPIIWRTTIGKPWEMVLRSMNVMEFVFDTYRGYVFSYCDFHMAYHGNYANLMAHGGRIWLILDAEWA